MKWTDPKSNGFSSCNSSEVGGRGWQRALFYKVIKGPKFLLSYSSAALVGPIFVPIFEADVLLSYIFSRTQKKENKRLAAFLLKDVTQKLHVFLIPMSSWLKFGHMVIPNVLVHTGFKNKIPSIGWLTNNRNLFL